MWHELYAPTSVSECTWSRQKVTELTNLVHRFVGGGEDGAVLLYGPSGSGKTTSIAPIVQSVVPDVSLRLHLMAPDAPAAKAVEDLQRFLSSGLSSQNALRAVPDAPAVDGGHGGSSATCSSLCIQVVKLLSFGESYIKRADGTNGPTIASSIERFLHHMTEERTKVSRAAHSATTTITFFLHTTHDSHSDKVNLNQHFGDALVNHARLVKFHNTAATAKSIKARLVTILERQAKVDAQRGLPRYRVEAMGAAEIDRIASCSNGDIRQALLQLQFMSIDPAAAGRTRLSAVEKRCTATTTQPSPVVVDLVDPVDDEVDRLFGSTTLGAQRKTSKRGARNVAPLALAPPSTPTSTIEDLLDGQLEAPTKPIVKTGAHVKANVGVRDEYIDVAHAAARLLTQKYNVPDVLRVLTVPPERLMGYMTNNMHHYFTHDQIDAYAACCELASFGEHFASPSETVEHGGGVGSVGDGGCGEESGGGGRRGGRLHTQEAEALAQMGLHVVQCGYCCLHRQLVVPKVLLSQKPPPFMPPSFPRISTSKYIAAGRRGFSAKRPRSCDGEGSDTLLWCLPADDDHAEQIRSHTVTDTSPLWREWADRVLAVCPAAPSSSNSNMGMHAPSLVSVMDAVRGLFMLAIDRKCCSAAEVVLDVIPMVQKIVFNCNRGRNSAQQHATTGGSTQPAQPVRGLVKRTMLNLRCSAPHSTSTGFEHPTPLPPPKHRLSPAQVDLFAALHRLLAPRCGNNSTHMHDDFMEPMKANHVQLLQADADPIEEV